MECDSSQHDTLSQHSLINKDSESDSDSDCYDTSMDTQDTQRIEDIDNSNKSGDEDLSIMEQADVHPNSSKLLFASLVIFIAIAAIIVMKPFNQDLTTMPVRFEILEPLINKKLFGQTAAVNTVLNSLQVLSNSDTKQHEIILLTGGPGVGKSYFITLLKDYFYFFGGQMCKNDSHVGVDGLTHSKKNCTMQDLTLLSYETVFCLDNSQVQQAIKVTKGILGYYQEQQKKLALLIPVLTIYAMSVANVGGLDAVPNIASYEQLNRLHGEKVQEQFSQAGIVTQLVNMPPLSAKAIEQCVVEAAERIIGVELSPQEIDSFVETLFYTEDSPKDYLPAGCKGIDELMLLEREQKHKKASKEML